MAREFTASIVKTPFTNEIERVARPKKFMMPKFIKFNGTGDPLQHLNHYTLEMTLEAHNDLFMCKIFPSSLTGVALEWFKNHPCKSIPNFESLCVAFLPNEGRRPLYNLADEGRRPTNFPHPIQHGVFGHTRLPSRHIYRSFQDSHGTRLMFSFFSGEEDPTNMLELNSRAQNYIRLEKNEVTRQQKATLVTVENRPKERLCTLQAHREPPIIEGRAPKKKSQIAERVTLLKVTLARLSLRRQVEVLIAKGELTEYLITPGQQRQQDRARAIPKAAVESHLVWVINTIHSCLEKDEQSGNSYRIQLKQAHKLRRISEINTIDCKPNPTQVSFHKGDLRRVQHPHEDLLVVSLLVANCLVRQVLIDPGSSVNIITKWTFDQLKLAAD
ncbi:uncharacterized protein LOC132277692 [Cornus florida]|uniref:uncharacterized protein LOC132277692 n=1 Tax=Cornus florida TaxID=4283 RepID=UPI0028A0E18B|nr:uncharacterized protein LOC132277692 [Cornus florida]